MKRIIVFCLVVCLTTFFVACSDTNGSSKSDSSNQPQSGTNIADNSGIPEVTEKLSKFEQFENALKEKSIQFNVTQKAATMIGAKEGYGYSFTDNTSVEVYLFDTSTDEYKAAYKSNKINLPDFGITMDVVFNGDICIFFDGKPINKDDILNAFNSVK